MRSFQFRVVALVATVVLALTAAGSAAASPSSPSIYLSKISLTGANTLYFGYIYNGVHVLGNNLGFQGSTKTFPNVAISVPAGTTFADRVLYLYDESCAGIYFDDGTGTADHATVGSGTHHRTVDIADAGNGCTLSTATVSPARGQGNLSLVEAIH